MSARNIIIDTDPGQDDAFAILLALGSPELKVVAVTAVAGNAPLSKTERNARQILELAGRPDIRVTPGCARPMVRPLKTAEYVHGDSGLEGCDPPAPSTPALGVHGVDLIIDTVMAAPEGEITLCPFGPLTNIAMALVKEPRIAPRIREIVLMGGGYFEGGNITLGGIQHLCRSTCGACRLHLGRAADDGAHRLHLQGDNDARLAETAPRAWHARGPRRGRDGGILATLRQPEIRDGFLSAARPMRDRLPAEARDLRREDVLRRDRDRLAVDQGRDGGRLVERN
jgi:inosine-uridine preferring nucleoside hydrolase